MTIRTTTTTTTVCFSFVDSSGTVICHVRLGLPRDTVVVFCTRAAKVATIFFSAYFPQKLNNVYTREKSPVLFCALLVTDRTLIFIACTLVVRPFRCKGNWRWRRRWQQRQKVTVSENSQWCVSSNSKIYTEQLACLDSQHRSEAT